MIAADVHVYAHQVRLIINGQNIPKGMAWGSSTGLSIRQASVIELKPDICYLIGPTSKKNTAHLELETHGDAVDYAEMLVASLRECNNWLESQGY